MHAYIHSKNISYCLDIYVYIVIYIRYYILGIHLVFIQFQIVLNILITILEIILLWIIFEDAHKFMSKIILFSSQLVIPIWD